MKNSLIITAFCLFCQISICQTNNIESENLKAKLNLSYIKKTNLPVFFVDKNLILVELKLRQNPNYFSVYNPNTRLNDIYTFKKDTVVMHKSILINDINFCGQKRDSFNPSGANNMGWAVFVGVYNLIFEK